jgi:hypothetical protein
MYATPVRLEPVYLDSCKPRAPLKEAPSTPSLLCIPLLCIPLCAPCSQTVISAGIKEDHAQAERKMIDNLANEIEEAAFTNDTDSSSNLPPSRGKVEAAMRRAMDEHNAAGSSSGQEDAGLAVAERHRFRAEQRRISDRLDTAATLMAEIARKLNARGKLPRDGLAAVENALRVIHGSS